MFCVLCVKVILYRGELRALADGGRVGERPEGAAVRRDTRSAALLRPCQTKVRMPRVSSTFTFRFEYGLSKLKAD